MRSALSPTACAVALLLALAFASPARADRHDLTIANAPTVGVAVGPGSFVPIADDAVLDVADLDAALATGDVTIDATVDDGIPATGQLGQVTFADGLDASATTGALAIDAAGALALPATPLALAGDLTLTAPLILAAGTVAAAGTISLGGPVTLTADTALHAGVDLAFTSTVDGPFALELQAGGAVTLPDDVGATDPLGALHVLGGATELGIDGTHRTVSTVGEQRYDGAVTVHDVEVDAQGGPVSLLGPTLAVAQTLTLGSAGSATGTLTGSGAIVRDGAGTFTLAGPDDDPTAPAPIALRAGTLEVTAPQHRTVQLLGGRLAGTGPVGAITDATATGAASIVAPAGAAIGTLASGPVDLGPRTTLALDLGAVVTDRLAVTGEADLDDAGLAVTSVPANLPAGMPITVVVDDGTDPVVGRFATLPDGAPLSLGGITYKIDYFGGDGNDVTLTRQPEPVPPSPPTGSGDGGGGATPAPPAAPVEPLPTVVVPPPIVMTVPPAPSPPTVALSGRRVTVRCPAGGAACTLKLAGRGSSALLVTTRRATAAAGTRKTVSVTLTARGRRKLRAAGHGHLKVAFTITARAGSGPRVTLRRTATLR